MKCKQILFATVLVQEIILYVAGCDASCCAQQVEKTMFYL